MICHQCADDLAIRPTDETRLPVDQRQLFSVLIVPLSYQAVYDMMEIILKILNPDLDKF